MALPTCKAGARRVIEELAADHWRLAPHIRAVGLWLAHQATVGLRDGRTASKTYDVDFVGGHGSFASITVHAGKWNRVEEGKVRLGGASWVRRLEDLPTQGPTRSGTWLAFRASGA